jgi:hypothetical protein
VLTTVLLGFGVLPAKADLVVQLNIDDCSGGGCLAGTSGGTVTVAQNTANSVTFTVQLASGLAFQQDSDPTTNNGATFTFNSNIIPPTNLTISALTTGWIQQSGTPTSGSQTDGFGTFNYGIACPSGTCQTGQITNPNFVTFVITNNAGSLNPLNFAVGSSNNGNSVFFAADVVSNRNGGITTGYIGGSSVPDGGTTAMLLGFAFAAVGLVSRRLK